MFRNYRKSLAVSVTLAIAVLAVAAHRSVPASVPAPLGSSPVFGEEFWKRWGDGKGEVSGYDLTFPRYGELRKGVAVVVFVTETFSNSARVKSDPGKHPKSDEFPVMKLNLVQDFSTGIYDYNLLTSAFVALAPVNGRPAGSATKISFSSQEWCGHTFQQLLFDGSAIRATSHSYFDGEADRQNQLDLPAEGVGEDELLLWARGMAAPRLAPGQSRQVPFLSSLQWSRQQHTPLSWGRATLTRTAHQQQVSVPPGRF